MEVGRNLGNCLGWLVGSSRKDRILTVDTMEVSRSIKKIARVRDATDATRARPVIYSGSSVFSSTEVVDRPLSGDRIVVAGVLMSEPEPTFEREHSIFIFQLFLRAGATWIFISRSVVRPWLPILIVLPVLL